MRTTNYSVQWSGNLGWSGTSSPDLGMTFSMNSVEVTLGGVFFTSVAFSGITDLSNLFEWWKILKVDIQVFTSSNTLSQTTAGNVAAMPISNIIFDPNDVASTSLSAGLQYGSLRTVQIGQGRHVDGFTFSIKPTPLIEANNPLFVGLMEPQRTNPFFSTSTGAVPHYGVKMIQDPGLAGVGTNSIVYTFYIRAHYRVKDTK